MKLRFALLAYALIAYLLSAVCVSAEESPVAEFRASDSDVGFASTGSTLREFLFFDIYHLNHYIDERSLPELKGKYELSALSERILDLAVSKQFEMRYMRDLSSDKVKNVLLEGFIQNASEQTWLVIKPQVEALLASITEDIREGDILLLQWTPQNEVLVFYNGEEVRRLVGRLFAKTLWLIWLGDKSVVDRLELLSKLNKE